MKLTYLICYAVAMCIISIHAFKKKYIIIYKAIWTAYAVSAVFCVLCKIFQETLVGSGIMQNIWYDLSDTTLWAYILIIICCTIAFRPFSMFDRKNELENFGKQKSSRQFFQLYAYVYILCAFIFIALSINTVVSVFNINDFGALRQTLYGNSENESEFVMTNNFIAQICYKGCLQLKYLSVYIGLAMVKEKKNRRLGMILILSSAFVYFLYAKANAARGGLLIYAFCSALIGINFFNYMSKANRRRIFVYGLLTLGVVFMFFMAITVSRFGNDGGGKNPILRNICFYLGHGPIEFSKVTGSLKNFAYGKTIIGRLMKHYFGTPYSWEVVQYQIGYPQIGPVFTTYLGYLYTDFGSIGCILFVTLWSTFMCKLIKNSPNRISTIFLFLYYLNYFVTGIFAIGRLEYAAFITTHILFLLIRFIEDWSKGYDFKINLQSYNEPINSGNQKVNL